MSVLEGLEVIINMNQEGIFKSQGLLKIFHKLYENDIVTEDVFYDWYDQVKINFSLCDVK